MAHCRELEKEIDRSFRHADRLLHAVLKEAFFPATPQETIEQNGGSDD